MTGTDLDLVPDAIADIPGVLSFETRPFARDGVKIVVSLVDGPTCRTSISRSSTADPCPLHGVWVCDDCGWRRQEANRFYITHQCYACPSSNPGTMLPLRHYSALRRQECEEVAAEWVRLGSRVSW